MKEFRNYTITDLSLTKEHLGIQILNLGHNVHLANIAYPDNLHPSDYHFKWEEGRSLKEYQIIYISKGEGIFEARNFAPQIVEAGTIILLYPGLWHRYKPNTETGWEEYWVGFTGNYAHHLLEQACFDPQKPIIKVGFNEHFLDTFSTLIEAVEIPDNDHQTLSAFLLIQLLGIVHASVLMLQKNRTNKEEIIYSIANNIKQNWQQDINFELLAKQHNVSYVWFRKAFKEVIGSAPNQYLLAIKLKKAELLLKESNASLSEIADKCGFTTAFYLSRIFKKKLGYNPSDVRNLKINI